MLQESLEKPDSCFGRNIHTWLFLTASLTRYVAIDTYLYVWLFNQLTLSSVQWNLIVGDLFKVKDDYMEYEDMAQELFTWLRSKTWVLALLREIQMVTIGWTVAILQAVLIRWLSHYLAYRWLLEVWPALELLILKHEDALGRSRNRVARKKAEAAIGTIKNATFWHAMAR